MPSVRGILGGRYELLDVVGRGGMGVVYRARDRVLERTVAVKVLPRDTAGDPALVARFEREARAAGALNNANIVAVFDTGREADTHYIVMEYVAGRSLAQLVRKRERLHWDRAVEIAVEVARALTAAHRARIIHRDIKPANVMVDDSGAVKVLNFGIARAANDTSLTRTAAVPGSAPCLAPEVACGGRADERSDIYSLGCLLYELLTGRPPFTGELAAAVLHQHTAARPRPARERNPSVSPAVDALLMQTLSKRPADRPQSAQQLAAALGASLRDPRRDLASPLDGHRGGGAPTEPT
jgi:serine/threonine-protein kinase